MGLVGPSGAGKTTLLKIIAGLITPQEGNVYFQSEILESKDKLIKGHEEIKMVFQDYALKHRMSVRENLRYALLDYEKDYQEQRIEVLLELCSLVEESEKYVHELSGGQQQRVAFARALANEPALIIMDEPFSNLDPSTKQELLQETKNLATKTGTTILLVTHDTRDAMEAVDRIAILIDGRISQSDTPQRIFSHPSSFEIARLFGYVNKISSPLLKIVSDETLNGSFGIWAHDIKIHPSGSIKSTVQNVIFKGAYNLLTLAIEEEYWIAYDFESKWQKGDQVNISVNVDNLIQWQ